MNYYDNFIARTLPQGINTTKGSLLKSNTQIVVNQRFNDSPTAIDVIHNGNLIRARVETASNIRMRFSKIKDDYKKVLFSDFSYIADKGDIFHCLDFDWICIDRGNSSSSNFCIITRCTYLLKWIDNSKTIVEQSVAVVNTEINSLGANTNATMPIPESRMLMILPINDNTLGLEENRRFMFKHKQAMKCTNLDMTSEDGLMFVSVMKDVYNPVIDNDILHIADYNQLENITISILNDNGSVMIGNTLQINAQLNDNGTIISGSILTYTSDNTTIATVDNTGLITPIGAGVGTITVTNGSTTAIYHYTVTAVTVVDNFVTTVNGGASVKLASTDSYTVSFTNNGVNVVDTGIWSITDISGAITTWASIVSVVGNTMTLKVTSDYIFTDYTSKYIYLHCKGSILTSDTVLRVKITQN